MGRLTPSFRQLYEETISELKMELQAALVDLGHKSAFDLLFQDPATPDKPIELLMHGRQTIQTYLNVLCT
jgi:hypothetical protein